MNKHGGHPVGASGVSGKAEALIHSGVAHKKKGEYDEAIADYTAALEVDPGNAETLYNRGVAYGMINDYESAIADYTSALRIIAARGADKDAARPKKKGGGAYRPKTFEDDALFLLYNNRGFACYKSEQYGNAIKDYTEVIKIDPKHDRAYSIRGAACLELGQFGDAVKDFSRVVRPSGYDYGTYFNRGLAYIGLGLYDAAIKDFSEAIRINPNCTEAHQELARAYQEKKQGGPVKGPAVAAPAKTAPAKVQDTVVKAAPAQAQAASTNVRDTAVKAASVQPVSTPTQVRAAPANVQDTVVKPAPVAASAQTREQPVSAPTQQAQAASANVQDTVVKSAPSAAPTQVREQPVSASAQAQEMSTNVRAAVTYDDDDAWVPGGGSASAAPIKLSGEPSSTPSPVPAPAAPVKMADEASTPSPVPAQVTPVKMADEASSTPKSVPAQAAPVKMADEAPPVKEAAPESAAKPVSMPAAEPLIVAVESAAEESAAAPSGRLAPIPIAPIKLSAIDDAPESESGGSSAHHETDAFPKAEIQEVHEENAPEIEMVPVKGGTFPMGSDEFEDERPVRRVTVSDFQIGKYPVTRKQWETVMGVSGKFISEEWLSAPVAGVNWLDAQTFIEKLNAQTGKKYRLPTEAEWEYAARGGQKHRGYKYSGSNNADDVAWYFDNSGAKDIGFDPLMRGYLEGDEFRVLRPVGTKLPNELGICDMSGNVYEWVNDWYGNYASEPQTDPKGPSFGTARIRRGGAWGSFEDSCCITRRSYDPPGVDIENAENKGDIPFMGLRLAM